MGNYEQREGRNELFLLNFLGLFLERFVMFMEIFASSLPFTAVSQDLNLVHALPIQPFVFSRDSLSHHNFLTTIIQDLDSRVKNQNHIQNFHVNLIRLSHHILYLTRLRFLHFPLIYDDFRTCIRNTSKIATDNYQKDLESLNRICSRNLQTNG